MPVSAPFTGSILLTDEYQRIYPPDILNQHRTPPRWTEGWIYFHELTAGDEVTVKFEEYDDFGQQMRVYDIQKVIYNATPPATEINVTPAIHMGGTLSGWIRISVWQSDGGPNYKNINYKFYEVT